MSLISKAKQVRAERAAAYSVQLDDFYSIAKLWQAYLGYKITNEMVAHMMMLLKIGRDMVNDREDNLIDIIGYADCLNEMRVKDILETKPVSNQQYSKQMGKVIPRCIKDLEKAAAWFLEWPNNVWRIYVQERFNSIYRELMQFREEVDNLNGKKKDESEIPES